MALVDDASGEVLFAAELGHRGHQIKKQLHSRRAVRRSRRQRKTRYRKPRWNNRRRKSGWFPPSLMSRIANMLTWVTRLMRLCPIATLILELVKFDMQQMENPEISGCEYQQGTLQGYEVREYLLQKWGHACTYCGRKDLPLQVEHIQARAKGGTNRVSNLTLSCEKCNMAKGTKDIRDLSLEETGGALTYSGNSQSPAEGGGGGEQHPMGSVCPTQGTGLAHRMWQWGLTKFNRTTRELPKTRLP